jgi:septum formation protein
LADLVSVRLTLVSASPRRRELLAKLGYPFDVNPSDVSERWLASDYRALATLNATSKIEGSPLFGDSSRLLLGADTIVVRKDRVFGKPAGIESARRMLVELSGHTHEVITGVSLSGPGPIPGLPPIRIEASALTIVHFRALTSQELDAYLEGEEWQGKAGAYAIQGVAGDFVSGIEGDFDNVVGLPTSQIHDLLSKHFSHCHFC